MRTDEFVHDGHRLAYDDYGKGTRPLVLLPASILTATPPEMLDAIIAHELAHIRRGDHWVAWLELAAGVVWWWNPLFWFTRKRLRESAEMACDALAIGTATGKAK